MTLCGEEIVVIGAAGRTGYQLLLELEKRRISAGALVRSQDRAAMSTLSSDRGRGAR
jgi:putative NADH-flavin reductase